MMRNYPEVITASFRYVVTRKPHRCEGCQRMIPRGSRVLYGSGKIGIN